MKTNTTTVAAVNRELAMERVARTWAATRFGCADDTLSRAASALWRAAQRESEAYDDLAAFYAPGECYGDVARGLDAALERELSALGFMGGERVGRSGRAWEADEAEPLADAAYRAVAARTSARWAHFNLR